MDTCDKLRKLWNILPSEGNADIEKRIWHSISRAIRSHTGRRRIMMTAAVSAAVAACVALGVFLGLSLGPETIEIRNRVVWSNNTNQILPDGSEIWLEKGSSLSFSDDFSRQREVWLEGDASFEIFHADDSSPFYVHLANSTIKVTGTGFTVRQDEESVAVTLHHGKVEMYIGDSDVPVIMMPEQEFIYNIRTGQHRLEDFFPSITWYAGVYNIENAGLKELSEFIKWRYDVSVSYGDMAGDVQKINGLIFHDEPVESVLDKICYVLKADCKRCEGAFLIRKK